MLWLSLVLLEGVFCVLFADIRLLRANGLNLTEIPARYLWFLGAYLILALAILLGAGLEIRPRSGPEDSAAMALGGWKGLRIAGAKIATGLAIVAVVVGIYSIYCLRFYPR